jgi:hypothetical protein
MVLAEKRGGLTPIAIAAATASTTTAAATAAAVATAATGRTFLTWPGFVDRQGAPLKVLLMEHRNGFVGIFLRAHFDKRKSARAARRAILHYVYCDNSPCLCKMILQIILSRCEG